MAVAEPKFLALDVHAKMIGGGYMVATAKGMIPLAEVLTHVGRDGRVIPLGIAYDPTVGDCCMRCSVFIEAREGSYAAKFMAEHFTRPEASAESQPS